MIDDLRHAVRAQFRNRAFAAAVVLSPALGIGVTPAVFSVVDRVLFRNLPYPNGARLVSVGITAPALPYDFLTGRA
jgi:hypothetical protein